METKKPKKEVNNSSAFSQLIEQVEKERKRAKVVYSVGITLLVISLLIFLLFSPFKVPVFSQIGDRILNRVEVEEMEEVEVEEKVEETVESEEVEEVEEEEKIVETKRVYIQQQTPPPSEPPPPPPSEQQPQLSCNQTTIDYYFQQYCDFYWKWTQVWSTSPPTAESIASMEKWKVKVDYYKEEIVKCGVPHTDPGFDIVHQKCDATKN